MLHPKQMSWLNTGINGELLSAAPQSSTTITETTENPDTQSQYVNIPNINKYKYLKIQVKYSASVRVTQVLVTTGGAVVGLS